VFLVGLRDVVRRADDGAMLSTLTVVGGVLLAATVLVAQAIYNSIVWVDGFAQTTSDDVIRLAYSTANLVFGASAPAFVLFAGSTAVAAVRSKVLPVVVAWIFGAATVVGVAGFLMQLGSDLGTTGLSVFFALMVVTLAAGITMASGKTEAAT